MNEISKTLRKYGADWSTGGISQTAMIFFQAADEVDKLTRELNTEKSMRAQYQERCVNQATRLREQAIEIEKLKKMIGEKV